MRGGQRHGHHDAIVVIDFDAVDQSQIVDIDRNFGVKNVLERGDHLFIEVAAGCAGGHALGLGGEEALKIVALALELVGRRFLDRRARRRGYLIDFLDCELRFLVHPKILRVRSIPLSSAAISL